MRYLIPVFVVAAAAFAASSSAEFSAADIVKRSVAATERNWNAAPAWAFTERDLEVRAGRASTRTYDVLMIEGSPYNMLVALNDQPLMAAEREKELRKLRSEITKRRAETRDQRAKRISSYERERAQDHALLLEMINAFTFSAAGVQTIRGRDAYVFDAVLRPDYVPKTRDAKILVGMKGRLYVDKATLQWARVEAEVVKPVVFFGFLAKVEPGTRFILEQAPVRNELWLPVYFSETIHAHALGIIQERKVAEELYSSYRPMSEAFADLGIAKDLTGSIMQPSQLAGNDFRLP